MSENLGLGQIIDKPQERDAVHIAVAPVVADELLRPGARIAFVEGSRERVRAYGTTIGIVDPYLNDDVQPGQRFWMFLYPGSITSLRHEWTHEAFAPNKAESEQWLRNFIEHADCPEYDTVIAAAAGAPIADDWITREYGGPGYVDSECLHFNGRDAHGEIPPEFWDHVEIVTGKKITKRASYFSCSC